MNRNVETHFSNLPRVDIQRSIFDRSYNVKTSFNAGELIPFMVDDNLPGDTFTADTSIVLRTTSAFIKPVMDNSFIDIYYFNIPNRLVWEHWKEFMGENNSGPWTQTTEYIIPQITSPAGTGWTERTIADYMGLPTKVPGLSVSALYFRAYALVWNEYFRDENLQNPTDVPKSDATIAGVNTGVLETDACKGGLCLPVNKVSDYFTKALPDAQKGGDVLLPLGSMAPIYGDGSQLNLFTTQNEVGPITITTKSQGVAPTSYDENQLYNASTTQAPGWSPLKFPDKETGISSGVYADLSEATAATINEIRMAFATQRVLEADARGGSRYTEMINVHFNVQSPDARLQRPEYLGGKRIPITINQVIQTSGTENSSGTQATPQANAAAYSHTADFDSSFTKSFTEHGIILGLLCVRTMHTYQQGIEKMWSRKRRLEYYLPALANIGEQPIISKEIYADGTPDDEEIFGYQEAWADYRYKPHRVTGQMRSNATGTLDIYHFADYYASRPRLSQDWVKETKVNIDRTLAVPSENADQFIADIYVKLRCARPMPVYSVPGLLDHN